MSNAYQRRRTVRLLKQTNQRITSRFIRQLEINAVQSRYEDAWKCLHGTRVTVTYRHGRYWVLGKSFLQSEMILKTTLLDAQLHERELNIPEEIES